MTEPQSPVPPRPSRLDGAVHVGCLALLLWLYGGDLMDAARARTATVSALGQVPDVVFAGAAVFAALAAAAVGGSGFLRQRPAGWKGYRLVPIVTVVVLFVDLFVLSSARLPITATDRAALAVQVFAQRASERSTSEAVASRPAELEALAAELGPAPYLVRGEPVQRFSVSVREGCDGPATDPAGASAATFLYCVAKDRKRAWVTLVGLPWGTRFGEAALFARGGEPVAGQVAAIQPLEADEQESPELGPLPERLFGPDAG